MNGIGISPGIGIGKIVKIEEPNLRIEKKQVADIEGEIEKLRSAIEKGKEQIDSLYQHTCINIGKKEAEIFQAHKLVLDDAEFFRQIEDKIREEKVNAEWALREVSDYFIRVFETMEDEYLKERVIDIKDVTNRIIKLLLKVKENNFKNYNERKILVVKDLSPSDIVQINKCNIAGIITEFGGKNSHTAIMVRTLNIPAVVGVENAMELVSNGSYAIVDGYTGDIFINPEKHSVEKYKKRIIQMNECNKRYEMSRGQISTTKDGFNVKILGNIGTISDVEALVTNDGEGVGLFRTEFIYIGKENWPTEEELFLAYKRVAERLENKPVTIRTLDIGGDKVLPYINIPEERNPFLGYRAIRFSLKNLEILKTQIRAILRASAFGKLRILFPMISSIEELRQAKTILDEAKKELESKKIEFDNNIEIGTMIEVPSAAVMTDLFANEVDFFSIGTNDLLQYTYAVDRDNKNISHLYNEFQPALLRLIKLVIDNGHKSGIKVSMCGEIAGNPKLIPILIGMGLDEFSMSPSLILRARWIIRNTVKKDMEKLVDKILLLSTAEEIEVFINENLKLDEI